MEGFSVYSAIGGWFMEVNPVWVLIGECILFFLFLFAGCRYSGKKIFNDDALSIQNVTALISISFIIMRINDSFLDMAYLQSAGYLRNFIREVRSVYIESDMVVVHMLTTAVFWFFTGFLSYRMLRRNTPNLYSKKTVSRAVFIPILVTLIIVSTPFLNHYTKEDYSIPKNLFRWTILRLDMIFRDRCLHVFPVLILLLIFSWIFIRILKNDLLGILIMSAVILISFSAQLNHLMIIGGASYILFPLGLLAAKYSDELTAFLGKRYALLLAVCIPFFAGSILACRYSDEILSALKEPLGLKRSGYFGIDDSCFTGVAYFPIYTVAFFAASAALCILILLILLKIRIGNPVMRIVSASLPEVICLTSVFWDAVDLPFWKKDIGRSVAMTLAYVIVPPLIMCLITRTSPLSVMRSDTTEQ